MSPEKEVEATFRFVACATPIAGEGDNLCAHVPDTDLLNLFRESTVVSKQHDDHMRICLNEHSILVYASLSILWDEDAAADFKHKILMQPSKEAMQQGRGIVGAVHYEWGWNHPPM